MKMKTICAVLLGLIFTGTAANLRAADNFSGPVAEYLTARDSGQQLAAVADLKFAPLPQPTEKQPCVFVDSTKTFQTLVGIGGALTDAAAETFYQLPKGRQQEFLRAYFDPHNGIGYTLGRTHINSCDFSSESYTYVTNNDRTLASFTVARISNIAFPLSRRRWPRRATVFRSSSVHGARPHG